VTTPLRLVRLPLPRRGPVRLPWLRRDLVRLLLLRRDLMRLRLVPLRLVRRGHVDFVRVASAQCPAPRPVPR
jgi:hypothetical protein